MKSNMYLNPSVIKNFDLDTSAITSTIMVCHPLNEPGVYRGIVTKGREEIATFTITCSDEVAETQADIDLYALDSTLESNGNNKTANNFSVHTGGYAVLYSSFGEGGYQVRLFKRGNDKLDKGEKRGRSIDYHTGKLQKGDIVLAVLMRPGEFDMTGYSDQTCSVVVEELPDSLEPSVAQIEEQPVTHIKLKENEFDSKEVKVNQGSALAITIESEGGVKIKLGKPKEKKEDKKEKGHNWENTKYKNPES